MQKITSINNKLISDTKLLHQKKYRDRSGLFLAEGEKVLQEAISARLIIKEIFSNNETICQKYPKENTFLVTEQIMKKLSTTDTPPEVIAAIEKPSFDTKNIDTGIIVLLDGIQDPGNLGTIIRAASAFDVKAILLSGETVDVYNPKVVRSTVGNLWKLPVLKISKGNIKQQFPKHKLIATTLDKTRKPKAFYEIKEAENLLIMFGSEASGLSEEVINQADMFVDIPMKKNVESLNLSVSAGIIMQYFYMKRDLE